MKRRLFPGIFFCFLLFRAGAQCVTNSGTDFWLAFPKNHLSTATLEFFISSSVATSGTVSSTYPGVNQAFTVVPGVITTVFIPSGAALQDSIEDECVQRQMHQRQLTTQP
jgi:hypothetical protein